MSEDLDYRPKRYGVDYGEPTDEVLQLALHDPYIHTMVQMWRHGRGDWADTLARMVVHLANENKRLKAERLNLVMNSNSTDELMRLLAGASE